MKWNHLPVAGGIYDQDPRLLEQWAVIFDEKNTHDEEEARRNKAGENSPSPTTKRR
jgi:hypothetical protein